MAAERRAEVTWRGDLVNGAGTIERVGSGSFGPLDVTWTSRTEEPQGRTSPEELIAAAHAACYSMALSGALAKAGNPPERLDTAATVTFVPGTGITESRLEVEGVVPGLDDEAFHQMAEQAKDNCPVSQALAGNVELSVTARLATGART
jgi:osmotically inducible protein OsmC